MIIEIKCHVKAWGRENELISIHMNVGSEMEMKFDIYVYDKLFIFMACLRYVTLHLSVALKKLYETCLLLLANPI